MNERASITYFCLGDINSNNKSSKSNKSSNGTSRPVDTGNGLLLSNGNGVATGKVNGTAVTNGGYNLRNGSGHNGGSGVYGHNDNHNNHNHNNHNDSHKFPPTLIASTPILPLHQMIQSASSDPSLIEHHANFTGKET